jgi:hypothetical protein
MLDHQQPEGVDDGTKDIGALIIILESRDRMWEVILREYR